MFERLGRAVGAAPVRWVAGWVAASALLIILSPSARNLTEAEPRSLLPADQPYNRAIEFERRAFPDLAYRTRTVLVFERTPKLTSDDDRYLADLSQQLTTECGQREGWSVRSPYLQPYLASRLESADGAAAMIIVNSNSNYLTNRSVVAVGAIEKLVKKDLPAGLTFEVTGEGGLGRDLAEATEQAFDRTTLVTLAVLIVILALVYRAPLAALVPLVSIGTSVLVAVMLLNQATRLGWGISTIEKTITVVLVFGSGTDYALFWLSAFRERLGAGGEREDRRQRRRVAAARATVQAGPGILTSAATTIGGLMMLMAANLLPSFNAGRALGIALTVSLIAALTLVPAVALLMGSVLYWPRRESEPDPSHRSGVWARLAGVIVRRPAAVTAGVLIVLAWPMYDGWNAHYTYDALGVVPANSGSERGQQIVREHFSADQIFSWTALVQTSRIRTDAETAKEFSQRVTAKCLSVPGVADIWSVSDPLGTKVSAAMQALLATSAGQARAEQAYVSSKPPALRFEIMLEYPPLSGDAMESCLTVRQRIESLAKEWFGKASQVHATGLTPYILNIKRVADRDHRRVVVLVVVVIFLIVLALVRRIVLAAIMLAATIMIYLVTLGVTEAYFVYVVGEPGIDWKVRLFSFVVLVAVGQDYNVFLITRLLQERARHREKEATRRAIAATGSVISSCGLIMAATLGSLAVTGLTFFQELGMAFAFGVLLDTFLVRPAFVPATYLLIHGRERSGEPPGARGDRSP